MQKLINACGCGRICGPPPSPALDVSARFA